MNKFIFSGNIGKDAETRQINDKDSVTSFNVAVTEKYKDKETTIWVRCDKWNAGKLADYLKKGAKVLVEGKILEREHEGKKYWSVNVESIEILKFIETTTSNAGKQEEAVNEYDTDPDSLPY